MEGKVDKTPIVEIKMEEAKHDDSSINEEDTTSGKIFGPPPRIRYSCTQLREKLYIFGGSGAFHASFWNDVFIFDTNTMTFEEPATCGGEIPLPRYGHTATTADFKKDGKTEIGIAVFGGKASPPHYLMNDLHFLNTETMQWSIPNVEGMPPVGRYYHTATNIGEGRIVIFGGRTETGESNDVFILDTKKMRWIKPNVSGKPPKKRYQHSAELFDHNKLVIYGGISKMNALQDIVILDLERMEWIKPSVKRELERHETRARDYTILAGDKLLVFNFESSDSSSKSHIIHVLKLKNVNKVSWETIELIGDIPFNSQFCSINSFGNKHFLIELKKRPSIKILRTDSQLVQSGKLEIKEVALPNVSTPIEKAQASNTVQFRFHYASRPHHQARFPHDLNFTYLQEYSNQHFRMGNSALFVRRDNHYSRVDADSFTKWRAKWSISDEIVHIYVAEAAKDREVKQEHLMFLKHQAMHLSPTSPITPRLQNHKIPSVNTESSDMMRRKSTGDREADAPLALPLLFSRPAKLSFIRRIHKYLKHFETWGLRYHHQHETQNESSKLLGNKKEEEEEGGVMVFIFSMLCWLMMPIYGFVLLFHRKVYTRVKLGLWIIALLYAFCLAVPILETVASDPPLLLGKAVLYAPLVVYLMMILMVATIQSTKKTGRKEIEELAQFRVTVHQLLVNHEYGERAATSDDIVFAITNKEETMKDSWLYIFMVYVFPFLGAAVHTTCTILYLEGIHRLTLAHAWMVNAIAITCIIVNFSTIYLFLFLVGSALSVYARQLTHTNFFSIITNESNAKELDLPTLPLISIENIMAWFKIRAYLRSHNHLPLQAANVILGWSLIAGAILWIIMVMRIFSTNVIFDIVTVLIITDALLLTVYFVFTFQIGAKINSWRSKHVSMLLREQLRLLLEIQHTKEEQRAKTSMDAERDISRLDASRQLIDIVVKIIQSQHSSFQLLGFSISETMSKIILGAAVSITVACIAHLELDVPVD